MSRRKTKREPRPNPLSAAEHQAVRHATRHGLYLLIEGTVAKRQWRIYERKTGNLIGWYWPDSGRGNCQISPMFTFTQPDHAKVMELLRMRLDAKG